MSGLEAQLISEQARANLLGGVGANLLRGSLTAPKQPNVADVAAETLKFMGYGG